LFFFAFVFILGHAADFAENIECMSSSSGLSKQGRLVYKCYAVGVDQTAHFVSRCIAEFESAVLCHEFDETKGS